MEKKNRKGLRICKAVMIIIPCLILASLMIKPLTGFEVRIVETGSMVPVIPVGSACVIDTRYPIDDIKKDDIISFTDLRGYNIIHRVVQTDEIPRQDGTNDPNQIYIETKGDANEVSDGVSATRANFHGKIIAISPVFGKITMFLVSVPGKIVIIGILIFFIILNMFLSLKEEKEEEKEKKRERTGHSTDCREYEELVKLVEAKSKSIKSEIWDIEFAIEDLKRNRNKNPEDAFRTDYDVKKKVLEYIPDKDRDLIPDIPGNTARSTGSDRWFRETPSAAKTPEKHRNIPDENIEFIPANRKETAVSGRIDAGSDSKTGNEEEAGYNIIGRGWNYYSAGEKTEDALPEKDSVPYAKKDHPDKSYYPGRRKRESVYRKQDIDTEP